MPVTITNATVLGGISADPGMVLRNSIVVGGVSGTLGPGSSHNLIGGDPTLGPLGDNGGPTFTHALLPGSPAIDAGSNDWAAEAELDQDQRGVPRVLDGDGDGVAAVDIGAFEFLARPLGTVDFLELSGEDSSAGELWYRLEAAHDGVLTGVAAFDAGGGDVEMELYAAADGAALVEAGVVEGGRRLDWGVQQGETYYLRLAGTNADVDLTLANLVDAVGDNVTVFGTDGDDAVTIEADVDTGTVGAITRRVTVNGVSYDYATPIVPDAPTLAISFDGGDGDDTAEVFGSTGDETAKVNPGAGVFEGLALAVDVAAETINVSGGGGTDTILLYDSPGDDTFVSGPEGATLAGIGYSSTAADAAYVHGYSIRGGRDTAEFRDSPGVDSFVARPEYAWMQSPGYFRRAKLFEEVTAVSENGGADVAQFRDSPGNEQFTASPSEGTMLGVGFMYRAEGFRYLHGYALKGGYDTASFEDSPGDDEFKGRFGNGVPFSVLTDGDTYFVRAKKFDAVVAYAGDGHDTASLEDLPGDDGMTADPYVTILSGPGHYNRAHDFEEVRCVAKNGGLDIAQLYDSPYDDTFTATPTLSTLEGPGYKLEAFGFDFVHAYGSGGRETAYMVDSPNNDRFVGRTDSSYMRGEDFFYRAKFFEEVYAEASEGADVAELFHSHSEGFPLRDRLEVDEPGGRTWARLSSENFVYDFLYDVSAFDKVIAQLDYWDWGPTRPYPAWLTVYGQ